MNNSSVYEMIIERGKQLGEKTITIEFITNLLEKRFEISTHQNITPMLETIDDLDHLKELFHEALEVEHLEDFIRSVQTVQNGS